MSIFDTLRKDFEDLKASFEEHAHKFSDEIKTKFSEFSTSVESMLGNEAPAEVAATESVSEAPEEDTAVAPTTAPVEEPSAITASVEDTAADVQASVAVNLNQQN